MVAGLLGWVLSLRLWDIAVVAAMTLIVMLCGLGQTIARGGMILVPHFPAFSKAQRIAIGIALLVVFALPTWYGLADLGTAEKLLTFFLTLLLATAWLTIIILREGWSGRKGAPR
jgi:hypothetical protein